MQRNNAIKNRKAFKKARKLRKLVLSNTDQSRPETKTYKDSSADKSGDTLQNNFIEVKLLNLFRSMLFQRSLCRPIQNRFKKDSLESLLKY